MRHSAGPQRSAKALAVLLAVTSFAAMAFAEPSHPDPVAVPDVTGNWKIDPTTFAVRSLATPNAFPRPHVPTNFNTFVITLNPDLTFATTNFPAKDFFAKDFNWPTNAPSAGKWRLTTTPTLDPKSSALAPYQLEFWFTTPRFVGWTPILSWHTNKTIRTPKFVLGPYRDTTGTYEWTVAMTRQN